MKNRKTWIVASIAVVAVGLLIGLFYARPKALGPQTEDERTGYSTLEDTNRVVARVGNLEVRFFRNITDLGGAHPEVVNMYEVVDLQAKRSVKATDVFGENALVEAFAKSISDDSYSADPKTKAPYHDLVTSKSLSELNRGLSSLEVGTAFSLGESCDNETFVFEPNTENFAIVDYNPKTEYVAVHLGISATSHVCDSSFPRLRLAVPAPANLKTALQKASEGIEGFFPKPQALKACDTCEPVDFSQVLLIGG